MTMKRIAAVGFALLGLAGCGSTATVPAGSSSASPSQAVVALDEHADRTTVTVGVGTTIRVDLHSTYWSAVASSAPQLVQPTGAPSSSASPSCRPGGGCGTVSSTFLARAAGSAQLTSQRSSCGEAKPCTSDQGTFTVTIKVTG
ncbi:hypothetical protein GCM10010193_08510 [Kitasatospora atroaurantiaca]|uniref:Uncharacterized protein n=1 Tax=Kitasatospora atroaurantiaca TaxID=285545 RepID=A0A561ERS4_9ACTN|nr:hypothetical protein [Kitasatospora atroaurantiaca]TWE18308.1 hypothetical protein FB465_3374 [Kitasatospora atroaurantiaca]